MIRKKVTKKKVTPRKKTVKSKAITIKDMKSWLSGVVEFQEKDWTPDVAQWKAILDKINNLVNDEQHEKVIERIIETHVQSPQHVAHQQPAHRHVQQPVQQPVHVPPVDGVSLLEVPAPNGDGTIIQSTAPPQKNMPIEKNDGTIKSSFD